MVNWPVERDLSQSKIHLIGIGGAGMSGAAALLLKLGARVSGSDATNFAGVGDLVTAGARVVIGHREEQLFPDTDLVVISAAIPDSNPELIKARRLEIPVIKYAQLLGLLMGHRQGVAIAGTHGKSTTTAMTALIFQSAGLDPSFVVGAVSNQLGGSSAAGSGPHFIVESCEFDRSFLHLSPQSAAILNVEADHLDCFGEFEAVVDAFSRFAALVPPSGLLVCNADDPVALRAGCASRGRVETCGFAPDADWRAVNLRLEGGCFLFDVVHRGDFMFDAQLAIPGRHNVSNALAAIALAHDAGADMAAIRTGLSKFEGVQRRMTLRGTGGGVTLVDDYAHHPTEIRATIHACRDRYSPRRTFVVFQPHQYARTCYFMDDFAASFAEADEIIIPAIYAAREPGADAVGGANELVRRIKDQGGKARYVASLHDAAEWVAGSVVDGDLVMTMGAGDVWKVADELVERICGPDRNGRPIGTPDLVSAGRSGEVPVSAA